MAVEPQPVDIGGGPPPPGQGTAGEKQTSPRLKVVVSPDKGVVGPTEDEVTTDEVTTTEEVGEKGKRISRRDLLKLAGAGVLGLGLEEAERQQNLLSRGVRTGVRLVENLLERTDGSKILESRNLLPIPLEDEIRRLSFIPKARSIGDGFKRLVPPELQEQAAAAKPVGYEIVYLQDRKNDTVGRSAFFSTKRSIGGQYYDIGSGWWFSPTVQDIKEAPAVSVTGVFKGWVRPPGVKSEDPDLYMLLGNPLLAREEWLLRIGDSKIKKRVIWIVDNLDVGGNPVPPEAYGTIKSFLSKQDLYLPPGGKPAPSISINSVDQLDRVVRPGDVIKAIIATKNSCQDEYGVLTTPNVYLRRFGGIEQIQKEIQ